MTTPVEAIRGEIAPVEDIITAEQAYSLGDTVRTLFEERRRLSSSTMQYGIIDYEQTTLETSRLSSEQSGMDREIQLSIDDHRTVSAILDRFSIEVARRNDGLILPVGGRFFVGTAGMSRWHIDPDEEYRLLVNLSRDPLQLHVTNELRPAGEKGVFLSKPPSQSTTLTYNPGGGVLLDNTCPRPQRTPHAGVDTPNKVYFRGYSAHPLE